MAVREKKKKKEKQKSLFVTCFSPLCNTQKRSRSKRLFANRSLQDLCQAEKLLSIMHIGPRIRPATHIRDAGLAMNGGVEAGKLPVNVANRDWYQQQAEREMAAGRGRWGRDGVERVVASSPRSSRSTPPPALTPAPFFFAVTATRATLVPTSTSVPPSSSPSPPPPASELRAPLAPLRRRSPLVRHRRRQTSLSLRSTSPTSIRSASPSATSAPSSRRTASSTRFASFLESVAPLLNLRCEPTPSALSTICLAASTSAARNSVSAGVSPAVALVVRQLPPPPPPRPIK
jgi:hypothetical protein